MIKLDYTLETPEERQQLVEKIPAEELKELVVQNNRRQKKSTNRKQTSYYS